ncbi:hypothetical protein PV04_08001 [Phialophora macrospora]|uniref:Uncharacterized protein n=1 Tax=Phialophora macrospora TaxID=1851006 RepID=A0A0D2G0X0_9EURO|nr:hypothetical protein PV04_08001 [Phialophora macrospora]
MQDVLNYAKSFEHVWPHEHSLNRLGPMLKFVDDFSTVVAVCFGADTKLTAFVWGGIRLISSLASSAADTLRDVLDVLEGVSLTLPRFRDYEQDLPMDKALETCLLNVYTEIICFYARAIQFFRSHPNILLRRHCWNDFESDFGQTVKRIRRMSSAVESEADLARMRLESAKYREVLDLMKDFKEGNHDDDQDITQCYHVPQSACSQFWGRDMALDAVKSALLPGRKGAGLKTFALYGMGGVGKTQIALHFAEQNREFFDSVRWLRADTVTGMGQSTGDLVRALGLVKNDEDLKDSSGRISKLKTWLRNTCFCRGQHHCDGQWLLVLDNADDAELLNQVWPIGGNGSVLITSRDFNVASHPASAGFHVEPFDHASGSSILLQLLSLDTTSATNQASARAIVQMLGGLPLPLNQIASFMSQRKMSLDDFLPMYKRHSDKIDAEKSRLTQYEHALSTVWDMSLSKLSGPSAHLQTLMAFFHPDGVHEKMLCEGSTLVADKDMGIFADDMELSDAEEVLLQMALVEKNVDEKTLSPHRLIQSAVLRRLSEDGRTEYFDDVVQILHYGFGDSWEEKGGYLFKAWKEDVWIRQENCRPPCRTRGKIQAASGKSAEIWSDAPSMHLRRHWNSLCLYDEALLAGNDASIAWAYNNLGMAYTELSDFDKALTCHKKAVENRRQPNMRPSSILISLASRETWSFWRESADLKVAPIDAMRIATKALAVRRRLLGNRLTTCDVQYHGNMGPSITMLEERVTIAETLPGGEGQSARANRKLAVLYSKLDRNAESKACLQRAIALRAKLRPTEDNDSFEEESFIQLCPWMLW